MSDSYTDLHAEMQAQIERLQATVDVRDAEIDSLRDAIRSVLNQVAIIAGIEALEKVVKIVLAATQQEGET